MNKKSDINITHYNLCKITAEKFLNQSKVVLYEYQSFATGEFPDVLRFKNGYTYLYEIKVSRQDFLKDSDKECRIEKEIKYFPSFTINRLKKYNGIDWKSFGLQEFIVQKPHLGRERFYVCPKNIIMPDEINNGFGLYWYDGKNLKKKKDSKHFKSNIYDELRILEHAFRKYHCGDGNNILINGYK